MERICVACKTRHLARLFLRRLEIKTTIKWVNGIEPTEEPDASEYALFFLDKNDTAGNIHNCMRGCSWEDYAEADPNFVREELETGKYKIYII